jgi:hypothetical protein
MCKKIERIEREYQGELRCEEPLSINTNKKSITTGREIVERKRTL